MRYPDDVPTLSDGVVTLRAATEDDLEGVYEQCSDREMQRWTTVPVPYTRTDAADFIARRPQKWADDSDWGFAIEAEGGAGPSGFGGSISIRPMGSGIGEIAYGAHPAVRGQGLMTRAVGLICEWAFDVRGLRTITWTAAAGNLASWRVVWRNGFYFEGPSRASVGLRDEALDGWHGSLLATDSREPKTSWLEVPRLVGRRVVLRPAREDDMARCLQATNDRESVRWLSVVSGFPRDEQSFRVGLRRRRMSAALGRAISWSMADPASDAYLGSLNLFGIGGLDHGSAELGYWAHPDARGRGVTSEAVGLAVGHAFAAEATGGLGLQRLSLNAGAGNLGSQGVARRNGFTETGRDRRCYRLSDGSVEDLVRFDLLRPGG